MIQIKKGLNLPISGAPQQQIENAPPVEHVALLGRDYHSMKPTLLVNEGDLVRLGQPLFSLYSPSYRKSRGDKPRRTARFSFLGDQG